MCRTDATEAAYKPLYGLELKLADEIRAIAQGIYRAADISVPDAVARKLKSFEDAGFADLPVCIAKTQHSYTADPTVKVRQPGTRCRARGGNRWKPS